MTIFCSYMRKGDFGNTIYNERLSKNEIRKQLIDSLTENEKVETEELNGKADKMEKCEDAANVIKESKDIICTKKRTLYVLPISKAKSSRDSKRKPSLFPRLQGKQRHHDIQVKHCKANT